MHSFIRGCFIRCSVENSFLTAAIVKAKFDEKPPKFFLIIFNFYKTPPNEQKRDNRKRNESRQIFHQKRR